MLPVDFRGATASQYSHAAAAVAILLNPWT